MSESKATTRQAEVAPRSGGPRIEPEATGHALELMTDTFALEVARGRVIGSRTDSGVLRKGADRESVMSIDHGALRIEPLVRPGWARAGIAYGPYRRRNGLAFGALLLNGHNISRTQPLPDELRMRLSRWLAGSETEGRRDRIWQWLRSPQKRFAWRRLRQWLRSARGLFQIPVLEENLAVGWFPTETPADPLQQGNALIVHAVVPEGGELWARLDSGVLKSVRGLQNVPVYYLIVLRERGAAYYAASVPGVPHLPAWPMMRLVAVDMSSSDEMVHAGIHQSVLGEIGFRADTRVYGTQVGVLPEFGQWYGSAHAADLLVGEGPLHLSPAAKGGCWEVVEGAFQRCERGATGPGAPSTVVLDGGSSSGLIHLLVETDAKPVGEVGVVWRFQDGDNYWCFVASSQGCRLALREGGRWSRFPWSKGGRLLPHAVNALQVADDGETIRLHLNGDLVYGMALTDGRLQEATGVGIHATGGDGGTRLRAFEAHPREIPIPGGLDFDAHRLRLGAREVVREDFEGSPADLAGHSSTVGARRWRRDVGHGVIELTGQGSARVSGSPQRPCPGRTVYTVEWSNPEFADVEATITPPGLRKKMKEKGRAGLVFWQDARNYITLSAFVEDWPAMSIAAFFQWRGFEELFDAVWSNVGNRMHWGVPHDFRVIFDGQRFQAAINGEPVLYRNLRDVYPEWNDFRVRRVGIVANWEWGNDTGSLFQNFRVRDLT